MCTFEESEHLKADGSRWQPFQEGTLPGDNGYTFEMVDGVFQIMSCKRNLNGEPNTKRKPFIHPFPCIDEFMEDQNVLLALSTHGPVYVSSLKLTFKNQCHSICLHTRNSHQGTLIFLFFTTGLCLM